MYKRVLSPHISLKFQKAKLNHSLQKNAVRGQPSNLNTLQSSNQDFYIFFFKKKGSQEAAFKL